MGVLGNGIARGEENRTKVTKKKLKEIFIVLSTKKKKYPCDMLEVLANATVAIVP